MFRVLRALKCGNFITGLEGPGCSCIGIQKGVCSHQQALTRFRGIPPLARPSSLAWRFGRYFKAEIAASTASLVTEETFAEPFMTRDTVAVETPASFAMSLIVGGKLATP